MDQELKYIFSNINECLKFAEAKHAGSIIFNSALLIGVTSNYNDIVSHLFEPALLVGVTLLGLSIGLSLLSQFPVTSNSFYNQKPVLNPNLYFYGDLSKIDEAFLIAEIKKLDNEFNTTKFQSDLINQILVNSRITKSKFIFFKVAVVLSILGIGIVGFCALIGIVLGSCY